MSEPLIRRIFLIVLIFLTNISQIFTKILTQVSEKIFLNHVNLLIKIIMVLTISSSAQTSSEDSLKILREKVIQSKNDSAREKANDEFVFVLEKILQSEESYKMNFDSVKQLGVLCSPDNTFRLITWNLPFDDETHRYFCYLQTFNKKRKNYRVFKLIDKSNEITSPENKILNKEKWLGALYYQIIPNTYKGKTYYTLLGWIGNNSLTRKKVIDVLFFANNGEPKFGDDIFRSDKFTKKRVVFEYSAQVQMSLKYHENKKQIIFDHLSPSQPELTGMFQYYGPDFSYDAFEWQKGKWIYKADVDARLEESNPIYNPEIKSKEKEIYSPKK